MIDLLKIVLFSLVTVLGVEKAECDFKLLLLHTNDIHARYAEVSEATTRCHQPSDKCFGGFPRLQTAIKQFKHEAKKKGIPSIYVDGGDVFEGTVYHREFGWKMAVKMMQFLQPDAMTLGDDEIEEGLNDLKSFAGNMGVVVCCNLDTSQEPNVQVKPSIVFTVTEGSHSAKIGILGYITQNVVLDKMGKVTIRNVIDSVKNEVERLKKVEKVDIIIALGHAEFEMNIEVAKEVGEIDVIVGGHTHAFLYNGWFPPDKVLGPYPTFVTPKYDTKKRIPIVEAYQGTKYLGRLELEFDKNWRLKKAKGNPVLLNKKFKQDHEVLEAMKNEVETIKKKYQYKISQTEITLQGKEGKKNYCKLGECNLGNMIADTLVTYAKIHVPQAKDHSVVGLMPGAAIHGSIYKGEITPEDVVGVLPATDNYLRAAIVEGVNLRSILEQALQNFEQDSYGELKKANLIQVSGIKLKYDLTKNPLLASAQIAPSYTELDDKQKYFVITTDSLAKKYDFIKNNLISIQQETDYNVVEEFIKTNGEKDFKKGGIYSKPTGRITINLYGWLRMAIVHLKYFFAKLNPFQGLYG